MLGEDGTDGVTIELLGPPSITVAGEPLRVDTRKAVAVLAIAAVDGPSARSNLAARLWPDSDDARARGALRRTMSVLNSALGGRGLAADPVTVALDAEDVWVDIDEVAAQLRLTTTHGHGTAAVCGDCLAPLRRAADLHRGEFLAGFTLRDSAEFDDWRSLQGERLRRELCGVLDRLTRAEAEAGELDAALAAAQRWLDLDTLGEQAHCRMMLLHAWRGERGEAIRRYRECAAVLDRELGVKPLARTTALYQAIVEGRLDRPAAPDVAPPPRASHRLRRAAASGDLPFVGRRTELATGLEHLTSADSRLLVVHGEAGIGKSRFVDELESRLHQQGIPVVAVRCHPGEQRLALAPVVELLRSAMARAGAAERLAALPPDVRGEAGRLLPALASDPGVPPPASLDAPGSHARFLDAVLTALVTAAAPPGTRPVVMIEDLHAADDATTDLLSYAIRRLADHPVGLVLTWRTEDMTSTASELHRAIHAPPTAAHSRVVELGRLSSDAIAELCRAALGETAPVELCDRVTTEAEGLPLAVVEYLRWLLESGESPASNWPIPSGVRALVSSRLDGLSETALQLTAAAAVLGHSVDLRLLARIAGRSDEETTDGADELLARGILWPATSGAYDFSHEKIRTVAYERTTPARRRLLHARAAEALAGHARGHRRGQLAAVIAEHARQGGDEQAAATWSVRAGDHAAAVFANAEARAHYERALALDHPDPTTVHQRLGRLKLLDGDYRGALESYETAAALAPDTRILAQVEHELGALHLRRGQWTPARAHLESALQLVPADQPGDAARITTDLGLTELQAGFLDAAGKRAATALSLAEQDGNRQALAQARNLMGLLARRLDDPAQSQRHLEHAAALASTLADPSAYIAALNNLALSTADTGDVDRAVDLLTTALERCERQGDRHRSAALHNNLADLHHRRGEEEQAMAHLTEAVTRFADVGEPATHDPEIWKLVEW
jgi:predicted ATPase/DNA-binding SARP family transcriptional activator